MATVSGQAYEIELSVDETDQPTTLAEHYFIYDQCLSSRNEARLAWPALYIGDFEKGADYKGNKARWSGSLRDHAAIAESLGPYKLSLHSGSDKLSIYPALARASKGRFHVKTAGTSYLEALRVVARHDASLFREVDQLRAALHYDRDKATYHVSATLDSAPPPSEVRDAVELERHYLERWPEVEPGLGFTRPGRQILHCTFGSVLTDAHLGAFSSPGRRGGDRTLTLRSWPTTSAGIWTPCGRECEATDGGKATWMTCSAWMGLSPL